MTFTVFCRDITGCVVGRVDIVDDSCIWLTVGVIIGVCDELNSELGKMLALIVVTSIDDTTLVENDWNSPVADVVSNAWNSLVAWGVVVNDCSSLDGVGITLDKIASVPKEADNDDGMFCKLSNDSDDIVCAKVDWEGVKMDARADTDVNKYSDVKPLMDNNGCVSVVVRTWEFGVGWAGAWEK